jgi:putative thioredoxin
MHPDPIVFDTDAHHFQSRVIDASHKVPVAVDFWADWCGPCRSLAPVIEKVVRAFGGALKLARVDTDKNRELASAQGIRGLPTVRLFKHGVAVSEFSGAYPESYVREFLTPHVDRESDATRVRAELLRKSGKIGECIALLRNAAAGDPQNHRIVLDLADALLAGGSCDEAASTLDALPPGERGSPPAKRLYTLIRFARIAAGAPSPGDLANAVARDGNHLEARLQLSARQVLSGNFEAAINELIEILRIDKAYGENSAHKHLLSLFELLGSDHPLVTRYRSLLATILY